jgi:hypothetical protein
MYGYGQGRRIGYKVECKLYLFEVRQNRHEDAAIDGVNGSLGIRGVVLVVLLQKLC